MSIIAEALKKAQATSKTQTVLREKIEAAKKEEIKDTAAKKSPKRHSLFFYTIFVTLLLLIIAAPFIWQKPIKEYLNRNTSATIKTQPLGAPNEVQAKNAASPEEIAPPKDLGPPPEERARITVSNFSARSIDVDDVIKLSGIMYTAEKPLAVINDTIWAEGEFVGRFKILDIEKDFIKVGLDGQEFVIKLKR